MIGEWLQWLLNIPLEVVEWFFATEIIEDTNITLGSTILYFFVVYIAVVFLNKFFWGKANEK